MLTNDVHAARSLGRNADEDETAVDTHDQGEHVKPLLSKFKASRTNTQSCLRESVMTLATVRSHQPDLCDLSVTRRDTVSSVFTGSHRARMNLLRIQNVLL